MTLLHSSAAVRVSAVVAITVMLAIPIVSAGPSLFQPPVLYFSGGYFPSSITTADVNGDGAPDLVIAHFCGKDCSEGSVDVLLGKADGTFQSPTPYASGGGPALSVATADINHDGTSDIVVANCAPIGSVTCPDPGQKHGVVRVLLGSGNGTFHVAGTYDSGGVGTRAVHLADITGDGELDLIVVNECDSSATCAHGSIGILSGRGDGTFQPAVAIDTHFDVSAAAVADLNGDGALDVAVASRGNNRVGVLLNQSNGTFHPEVDYDLAGIGPNAIAATDVDDDQIPDLIVANTCNASCTSGSVEVLLGHGDGTFAPGLPYDSGGQAQSLVVADVNRDNRNDLLVANYQANNVGVLLGHGDGTFDAVVTFDSGGENATSLAVADVNGDTAPDVLVTNVCDRNADCSRGLVSVLLNNTPPITVLIDIRPGETQNMLNPVSHAIVSVAVLTTDLFDVTAIDPATVRFGPRSAHAVKVFSRDVDRNGHPDLVFQFNIDESGIACADTTVTLVGRTFGGVPFRGTNAITTIGCQHR
jgi:hypothetical protein